MQASCSGRGGPLEGVVGREEQFWAPFTQASLR
jgi:hypothetical protein